MFNETGIKVKKSDIESGTKKMNILDVDNAITEPGSNKRKVEDATEKVEEKEIDSGGGKKRMIMAVIALLVIGAIIGVVVAMGGSSAPAPIAAPVAPAAPAAPVVVIPTGAQIIES